MKRDISQIVEESFYVYAIKTITDRAIPHLYDGLKPVQRRIIYSMFLDRLFPNRPYKKSARVVGQVLGKFHPHSDGSVYGALVNMTPDYMLWPLIDGQGNFGTRGEDPPAAMRYTECRLHENALTFYLKDLLDEPRCVGYRPNYDQTEEEPTVLPARLPMVLVNPVRGIAVSLASTSLSHNVREVCDLVVCAIDDDLERALSVFRGPDHSDEVFISFPEEEKKKLFFEGSGTVRFEAKIEEAFEKKRQVCRIWSIPPTVSRKKILEQILALKKTFRLEVRTYSKPDRPKIEVILPANQRTDLKKLLLSKTSLRTSFTYDLTVLDGTEPKKIGVWPLLKRWLEYRKEILLRKFELERERLESEKRFLDLFRKVAERADEFIERLRKSKDEARSWLKNEFSADDEAVQKILSVRVSKFSREESEESIRRLEEVQKRLSELERLISDSRALSDYIKKEVLSIKEKFPEPKTKLIEFDEERKVIELPQRLSVVESTKIQLGSGSLFDPNHSVVIIGEKGTFRIRVRELKKFASGKPKIDAYALSQGLVGRPLFVSLTEKYVLCRSRSGRLLFLDVEKLRSSGRVRNFGFSVVDAVAVDEDDYVVLRTPNRVSARKVEEFAKSKVAIRKPFGSTEFLQVEVAKGDRLVRIEEPRSLPERPKTVAEIAEKPISVSKKATFHLEGE